MPNYTRVLLAAAGLAFLASSQVFAAAWQVVDTRAGVQTEIDVATAKSAGVVCFHGHRP